MDSELCLQSIFREFDSQLELNISDLVQTKLS